MSQARNPAPITFRNNFNFQDAFDGGVLEISIDGGVTFQDILTVGTFVTGVTMARSAAVVAILWLGGRHGLAPRPALVATTVNLPVTWGAQHDSALEDEQR